MRRKPPTTRESLTHRFEILAKDGPVEGYITVGMFADGTPAEMFLVLARAGESMRGLARCWATCFSLCLQSGIPLEHLVEKFKYFRFEPAGFTRNPDIPNAQSIADYVARWMELTFLNPGTKCGPGSARNAGVIGGGSRAVRPKRIRFRPPPPVHTEGRK